MWGQQGDGLRRSYCSEQVERKYNKPCKRMRWGDELAERRDGEEQCRGEGAAASREGLAGVGARQGAAACAAIQRCVQSFPRLNFSELHHRADPFSVAVTQQHYSPNPQSVPHPSNKALSLPTFTRSLSSTTRRNGSSEGVRRVCRIDLRCARQWSNTLTVSPKSSSATVFNSSTDAQSPISASF